LPLTYLELKMNQLIKEWMPVLIAVAGVIYSNTVNTEVLVERIDSLIKVIGRVDSATQDLQKRVNNLEVIVAKHDVMIEEKK